MIREWLTHLRGSKAASGEPIDSELLNAQMDSIQAAGDVFNEELGRFDDHIGNGIAGAAAVAGLKILRRAATDLNTIPAGTVVLADVHDAETNLFKFMQLTAQHLSIQAGPFWKRSVPGPYRSRYTAGQLSGTLENLFDRIVARYDISPGFHPFVAVYAAMRTVAGAHQLGYLHCAAGYALAREYLVAGARTAPTRDT